MLRRTVAALVLLACALWVGEASAAVRYFPGCGATLATCLKNAPGGTTVRLRTDADLPIPDELILKKSLTIEAAAGFTPGIVPSGTLANIYFELSAPRKTVVIRGIRFVQVSVGAEFVSGTGHAFIFERNSLERNSGTNGDHGVSVFFGGGARGSVSVRNNLISSAGAGVEVGVRGGPATITGNRVTSPVNGDSQGGIFLYSSGTGTVRGTIASNLVHDVAGCNCGTPAGIQVRSFDSARLDLRVFNNTLHAVGLDETHGGMAVALIPWDATARLDAKLYNNIVSDGKNQGIVLYTDPTMTVTGGANNVHDTPGGNALGPYDIGAVSTDDPEYVDAAGGDFSLSPLSTLADAGVTCIASTPLPRGDAAGKFRVAGWAVDLGAFERDSTVSGRVKGKNLSGNGGPNRLKGTSGRDILCGMNGADTLEGLGGADLIFGGNGPDRAYGGDGHDWLMLQDGLDTDRAYGGAGSDFCLTDPGDLRSSCS